MKKKSFDEYGMLITREMFAMVFDEKLTSDQRIKILCYVMGGDKTGDNVLDAFADSLKQGFTVVNNKRKAEILFRRERQKKYQKALSSAAKKQLSTVDNGETSTVDERASIEKDEHLRASHNKLDYIRLENIPLNPPSGVEGREPEIVVPEDLVDQSGGAESEEVKAKAFTLLEAVQGSEAFRHMRVNGKKLMKCLISILKKNSGAETEIVEGLTKWTAFWKREDWKWAPGRITDWLYDGKYLEEPRKKEAAVERSIGDGGTTAADYV